MNKDKLLTLFMGKCWHEGTDNTQRYIRPSPCVCGKEYTTLFSLKNHFRIANPDFSQPSQRHEFLVWLWKEHEDMWFKFVYYAEEIAKDDYAESFIPWLFSDLSRFRDLFADFLCLPETIERWGTIECEDNMAAYPHCVRDNCDCEGKGKFKTPWAREASEKPVHISDKKEATDE